MNQRGVEKLAWELNGRQCPAPREAQGLARLVTCCLIHLCMGSAGEVCQEQPLWPGVAEMNLSWGCLSQVQRKLIT